MNIIAIIPARSGSKGLKNKNILPFNGKPLFIWSILEATKSNIFDEIVVAIDSKKYGKLAKDYDCKIIYRNNKLSNNKAPMFNIIKDVLSKEKQINYFLLISKKFFAI